MLSQELGDCGLAKLSLRDRNDDSFNLGLGGCEGQPVKLQESEGSHRADALVAVHEGVVLDDVVEIGSGWVY